MLQSLRNRRNRKGFTLAELLIVVAIIAVLVAIAVPLFVGALQKANDARDDANIRAVRGAAAVYLLEKSGDDTVWTNNAKAYGWKVTAEITANGEIVKMDIAPLSGAWAGPDTCAASSTTTGGFTVTLGLKPTDISSVVNKT